MSTVNQLRDILELSIVSYKRNKGALDNAVQNKSSIRSLKSKMQNLEESVNHLNASHTSWVIKSKFDDDALAQETYSNQWLEKLWNDVDEILDKANDIIEQEEKANEPKSFLPEQSLLILQQQMNSLQISINDEIDALIKETNVEKLNESSHNIYSSMVEEVNAHLNDDYGELSRSILQLSHEEFEDTLSKHEEFKRSQQKRILNIRLKLAGLAKSVPTEHPPRPMTAMRTVEMEKCKAPTFNGNVIEYPEFKRAWCKIAGTVWDDANQIEQMKFKVDGHTKQIISRCVEMEQAWEALDI